MAAPAASVAGASLAAVSAYAAVLADRFAVAVLAWHSVGLAAVGPFFFSAGRWHRPGQHQLALMPGLVLGKGGQSVG